MQNLTQRDAERRTRSRRLRSRLRAGGRRQNDVAEPNQLVIDLTGPRPTVEPTSSSSPTPDSIETLSEAISNELTALLDPTAFDVSELVARHSLAELSVMPGLIAHRARIKVEAELRRQVVDDPPVAVLERLGPRPEAGASRIRWDEAAENVALYCVRWGVELDERIDSSHPWPPRPTDDAAPEQHSEYWQMVDALRRVRELPLVETG